METLVNRVVEQGLPTYLLDEIDLLVFPRHTDGERYVGEAVELVDETQFREYERERDDGRCGVIRKDGTTVYWNTVVDRTPEGSFEFAYDHPALGDENRDVRTRVFERIATLTDRQGEAVETEFHRKHRYVQYLEREGITDGRELFAFLADLRTDEAATVERIRHRRDAAGPGSSPSIPTDGNDRGSDRLPDGPEPGGRTGSGGTGTGSTGSSPSVTGGSSTGREATGGETGGKAAGRNDPRSIDRRVTEDEQAGERVEDVDTGDAETGADTDDSGGGAAVGRDGGTPGENRVDDRSEAGKDDD